MNHIWMYWENAPGRRDMPPLVRHCIDSVQRHRGRAEVHLLDERTVLEFLPGLRPEWRRLSKLAHKADYVRTRLLLQHGGLWLDCDIAALRNLEPLLEIPEPFDFACQENHGAINCFAARPGCKLLRRITAAQDEVLDTQPDGFPWNAIGNDLLREHGADYPHHVWVKWTVDHVPNGEVSRLLRNAEDADAIRIDANAVLFDFLGNSLYPLLETYAPHRNRELLPQSRWVSKILRQALGVHEPTLLARLTNLAPLWDSGAGVLRRLGRLGGRA
jgi:hypothetical protein